MICFASSCCIGEGEAAVAIVRLGCTPYLPLIARSNTGKLLFGMIPKVCKQKHHYVIAPIYSPIICKCSFLANTLTVDFCVSRLLNLELISSW